MEASKVVVNRNEIKDLYLQVKDKTSLLIKLADKYEIEPVSVRTNWFGNLVSVPKRLRLSVYEDLKQAVADQTEL